MKFYVRRKRSPVINIVTLIDILILLLIFFVITTTFKRDDHQLGITLPESASGKTSDQSHEAVMVYATKDQKIFIGKEEVPLSGLSEALKSRKAQAPQSNFALKADKDVPLGFFVKVLDAATQAGLPNLSLSTAEAQQP